MQLFAILFSYTILKQFFNILATQNKNYNQNWTFLTKDMILLKTSIFGPFRLKCYQGKIFCNFFVFAHTFTLKSSYCCAFVCGAAKLDKILLHVLVWHFRQHARHAGESTSERNLSVSLRRWRRKARLVQTKVKGSSINDVTKIWNTFFTLRLY